MARIVAMEEAANRGDLADLQWFWHHMLQTDVTVASAVAKRLSHIDSLDWEIRSIETADPVLAEEQAAVLRYAYDRIENLKEAAAKLAFATFTGFAVLERIKTGYGPLASRLEYIPCWYWSLDRKSARWYFNPEAKPGTNHGELANERDLIIHHPAEPLFKSIGRHFFSKQLALADWDIALENGANQSVFVIGPPGTTPEKEQEYLTLAENVTSNLRGYLPNGADVKVTDLAARSKMPYFERIDYADKQIVMAATGGLLTMLTQSGSGTLAGGAHSDTLLGLARADAAKISEVFQQQFDRQVLKAFFPGQPIAVYFQFDLPQPQETLSEIIEAASGLSWSGYRIEKSQLEEKLGLRLEMMDQMPNGDPAPVSESAPIEPVPMLNRSSRTRPGLSSFRRAISRTTTGATR
jgi:phage gp29-like protein